MAGCTSTRLMPPLTAYMGDTDMLLKDKVAVVTGAASLNGIGWAIAGRFAEEGAKVVLLDIAADKLEIAKENLGDPHQGLVCDVRQPP